MSDTKERHWTDDPDLIERYVLNRLNATERNELEDHLRVCEVCKLAVRAEQVLIAGIRRSGREQLKSTLAEKTAALPERATPWGRILSAAAVLLILFTVGIYNRWFDAAKIEGDSTVVLPPSQQEANETIARDQGEPGQDIVAADKVAQQERKISPPLERREEPPPVSMRQKSRVRREGDNARLEDEVAADKQLAAETSAPRAMAEGAGAVMMTEQPEAVWLQGTMTVMSDDIARAEPRFAAPETRQTKKAETLQKHDAVREAQSISAKSPELQNIILQQADVRTLPLSQQTGIPRTVPAKIERIGNATQLTLYFDSLLDEKELAKAAVEMQHADSIAVTLPNRKISFYLPAQWKSRMQTVPAK